MTNLAGEEPKITDITIREELHMAGIPTEQVERSTGEVRYSYVGRLGKWTFRRAWYYWIASVGDNETGMPLKDALVLYNKKHPVKDAILGNIIRSGGDAGCSSPDGYTAQPVYNDELDEKLMALGYKKQYVEFLKKEYIPISDGELAELCKSGKLIVERYVSCYHIDEQIGLNEFAAFLKQLA